MIVAGNRVIPEKIPFKGIHDDIIDISMGEL
jgi:hypothetical protein